MFQPKPLEALHFQQAILRVMNEKDPKWLLGCAGLGIESRESKDRGGFQDGHLESMFVDARNTQELPGLDTIEGWGGVHPIIVVTARDWARMRGRPLHVWELRMWRYRNGFRSNDGKDWGGCVSGFQRIVVHGMDSGMRNFTRRLTTIHFPDSLAMARMGPIEVHVHQRRVSNCTVAARQGDRLTLATRTQHESQFMPDPQGNKATRFDNSSDAPLDGQYP
ncbi:hypothetical protein MCOR28_004001 [Pyricularia oryzae]|nr:hypothetical protein MCOR26_007602 [Pyricularia oryzae]KAI6344735.1 hypothetical protein MCOR28_004001 [Pyricularia oryzae]KAI6560691.1 hypothetical protein MCOR09_008361 [Pyricularia oryzae]KAI6589494.1 hypothetical protein MCOR04_003985 [Pyricularia oryzae]